MWKKKSYGLHVRKKKTQNYDNKNGNFLKFIEESKLKNSKLSLVRSWHHSFYSDMYFKLIVPPKNISIFHTYSIFKKNQVFAFLKTLKSFFYFYILFHISTFEIHNFSIRK